MVLLFDGFSALFEGFWIIGFGFGSVWPFYGTFPRFVDFQNSFGRFWDEANMKVF